MSPHVALVTDTTARAVTASRPRTRYVAGRGARTTITVRQLLPDRVFDVLITSGYEMAGKLAARQQSTGQQTTGQQVAESPAPD